MHGAHSRPEITDSANAQSFGEAQPKRELVFRPTPTANLVACICGRCRWAASVEYGGALTPGQAAQSVFDAHDCEDFAPREEISRHMSKAKLPPHLIDYQGARRCSICKMPFPPDAPPSQDEAFAEHVLRAHRPGQTSEDVNQSAARIVQETTDLN